jgi:hypothetical protein
MPSAAEIRQKLEAERRERQRREQEEKDREDAMLQELAAAEEAERVAEEKRRLEVERRRLEEERRRAKEEEMRRAGEARRKAAEASQRMEMTVVVNRRAPTAGPSSPAKAGRSTEVETDCWFCRSKGLECVQKV